MAQFRIDQPQGLIAINGAGPDPGNIIRVFPTSQGGLGALGAVFALIAGSGSDGQQSGRDAFAWAISWRPAFAWDSHFLEKKKIAATQADKVRGIMKAAAIGLTQRQNSAAIVKNFQGFMGTRN